MIFGKKEYKVVVRLEQSIMINKKELEAEIENLKSMRDSIEITDTEKDELVNNEIDKRAEVLSNRIMKKQELLDKINGDN